MTAKRRFAWLISAVVVVFALLSVGAVVAGMAVGSSSVPLPVPVALTSASALPSAAPRPSPALDPPRPVPSETAAPSQLRSCSVAALATDPRLANFEGTVMNTATGEILFDRSGSTPARPGSIIKLLTTSAALATLGPDYRIQTKVMATAGTLYLVGGGDPTLSALPAGQESFYAGAPKLAALAAAALSAYNSDEKLKSTPITHLVLDSTLWDPADNWDPSVNRTEQTNGYLSETTALQVDGDRANPIASASPRSTDPIGRAGAAFLADLGLTITPTQAKTPTNAQQLAVVSSQPVTVLVQQMLAASDNTLAENIARLVSLKVGQNGSAASLARAIPTALQRYGIDTTGVAVRDGSGESELNGVSPAFVSHLMIKIAAGGQSLNIVYAALPVAGEPGSLAYRFIGPNAIARGAVTAKPGWVDSAYTLAGIIRAKDGAVLSFAFYALRPQINPNAQVALDTLATGVFSCGNNLSNN